MAAFTPLPPPQSRPIDWLSLCSGLDVRLRDPPETYEFPNGRKFKQYAIYNNTTVVVPTTGQTVTLIPVSPGYTATLHPASQLAALTVALNAGTNDGDKVFLAVVGAGVTAVTWGGGNIIAASKLPLPTSLVAGSSLVFQWSAGSSQWVRWA